MATIGDILFRVRSAIPDMPPALPAPAATITVSSTIFPGSTLASGDYYVVVTQSNPWGETFPSAEGGPFTITPGKGIQVVSPFLPGCTKMRAYLTMPGGSSGTEIQYVESLLSNDTFYFQPTGFGTPPTRSTAYLMDSDGPQFGASTVYGWLNEALNKLSRAVGGMQDYSGVPTAAGQPMYVCPGQWGEIRDVWYGGYWVQGAKTAEFFRRNTITSSVLSKVNISVFSDKQIMEVYPQPDRDAGVTTTTANMGILDTSVGVADPGVFYLPFGFCQIGTEICAYANTALSGLIRALGSTVAVAWPSGTTVTELSLFWCGKRLTLLPYQPGNALMNLAAPQGWVAILPNYMLAQAKKAELDLEAADKLEQTFFKEAQQWMDANKPVNRFIQVGGNRGTMAFDCVLDQGVIVP